MIEFSKQISEKWNLPVVLSEQLCTAFENHDTPNYLIEYRPEISVELTLNQVWEIYDFMQSMDDLSAKKKRVLTALKKAESLTPSIERRVNLTTNTFDLDDLLIPLRPNPRSKGQLASKKGLDPLADIIIGQKEEKTPVEELTSQYIGKDPSLATNEDVVMGLKDIIAERFAYDDTVRAMCREFCYDDGFFEITPKNKKDPLYASYLNKSIPVQELTKEELLKLMIAEDQKLVRLKLNVQLFRITELIRHHFITNPDSVGFDILCEAIDDCWLRLLQPFVERDVKTRIREEAEDWASKQIINELGKRYAEEVAREPLLIVDASPEKNMLLLAVSGQGNLLGATTEKKPPAGKTNSSDRLRQFLTRHRPLKILLIDNEQADLAESIIKPIVSSSDIVPEICRFQIDTTMVNPSESEWVQKEFSSLLEADMRSLYGIALQYIKPITLIPKIGVQYYSINSLQTLIPEARFLELISRNTITSALQQGVVIKDIADSQLSKLSPVTGEILQAIKTADFQGTIGAKKDLLKVPGMTDVIFRNIAGFVIIPNAESFLDRTMVHPDFFDWFSDISEQLTVSLDTIVNDPEIIRSYDTEDSVRAMYIERKLVNHLEAGKRFLSIQTPKSKRKLKLNELVEGAIVSGRVTNITPFGVFVNINAVCDGLIHISQLADEYVETPEQVVTINEKVDVKILKVDVKKRRISLTMKNLGNKAPKVKPSVGQLSNLADHFKNR